MTTRCHSNGFSFHKHWSENPKWRSSIDRGGGKGDRRPLGDYGGQLKHAKNLLTLYATHAAFNEALIEKDRYGVNK